MFFLVPKYRYSEEQDHNKPFKAVQVFRLYKTSCPLLIEAAPQAPF